MGVGADGGEVRGTPDGQLGGGGLGLVLRGLGHTDGAAPGSIPGGAGGGSRLPHGGHAPHPGRDSGHEGKPHNHFTAS